MTTETRCAVCDVPETPERIERFAELDLCRLCFEGAFEDRLAAKGFSISQERRRTENGETIVVRCDTRRFLDLEVSFDEEDGFTTRLAKLFKKEVQAGDPLFDERVFIRTATEEGTQRLLEDDALRAVVMETLGRAAPITIEKGSIFLTYYPRQAPPPAPFHEVLRCAGALLHCLEAYAIERGLPIRV